MDPQTGKTGNSSADVKKDLSETYLIMESPAESPKVAAESTENNPEENRGSKKRKTEGNKLEERSKAEDETQNMDQTNIDIGSTETITEGNANGKRKRSRIIEEINVSNKVNSSSDSKAAEGIEGKVTENGCLAKGFEIYVGKESPLSVSVHNKENPLELCKDKEVDIFGRRESSLVGLMQKENHLSICKDKETVTFPCMVEGSSNQVSSEIVGEGPEQLPKPIQWESKIILSESGHSSFPCQTPAENVMIKYGLYQLRDEVVINEKQGSAEDGSMKEAGRLSNDLEYNPGIPPIPSVKKKLIVLDVNGLLANIVMPAPKDYREDTRILGRAIFKRPFCDDFLKFCFQNFVVGVWSSRSKYSSTQLISNDTLSVTHTHTHTHTY